MTKTEESYSSFPFFFFALLFFLEKTKIFNGGRKKLIRKSPLVPGGRAYPDLGLLAWLCEFSVWAFCSWRVLIGPWTFQGDKTQCWVHPVKTMRGLKGATEVFLPLAFLILFHFPALGSHAVDKYLQQNPITACLLFLSWINGLCNF